MDPAVRRHHDNMQQLQRGKVPHVQQHRHLPRIIRVWRQDRQAIHTAEVDARQCPIQHVDVNVRDVTKKGNRASKQTIARKETDCES